MEESEDPTNFSNAQPTPNEEPTSGEFIINHVPDVEDPINLNNLNSTKFDTPMEENQNEREEEMITFNEDHKSRFVESSVPPLPPTNF